MHRIVHPSPPHRRSVSVPPTRLQQNCWPWSVPGAARSRRSSGEA